MVVNDDGEELVVEVLSEWKTHSRSKKGARDGRKLDLLGRKKSPAGVATEGKSERTRRSRMQSEQKLEIRT